MRAHLLCNLQPKKTHRTDIVKFGKYFLIQNWDVFSRLTAATDGDGGRLRALLLHHSTQDEPPNPGIPHTLPPSREIWRRRAPKLFENVTSFFGLCGGQKNRNCSVTKNNWMEWVV